MRLSEHHQGGKCVYTSLRRPIKLVWNCEFPTRYEAKLMEARLKKWSRTKKMALVEGKFEVLRTAAQKQDFRKLGPGRSLDITVGDLSEPARIGVWDMSSPGVYNVEIWYETYLTGRYIGVHAWTGMTNHVVVQVTVAGNV